MRRSMRGRYRHFVKVFVDDLRFVPKNDILRYRAAAAKRVPLVYLDTLNDAAEVAKFNITKFPFYVVMEREPGFNDGMFKTPYEIRRTADFAKIEEWAPWLKN